MQIHQPKITQFESLDIFIDKSTEVIIDSILDISSEKSPVRICLSGGQTPLPIYKKLGENHNLNWYDVELFQTDERLDTTNETDSNQYNIETSLGPNILDNIKHFYKINTNSTKDSASLYSEVIDSLDGVFFDLAIIGIGDDGHFASLFPNGNYLKHNTKRSIQTKAPSNYPNTNRVSLTIETILNSQKILVLLQGSKKSTIIAELLEGQKPAQEYPAKFLLSHPDLNIFYCNKDE